MTTQPNLTKLAKAKVELLRRQAWDDFYIFAKYVCGNDLMEEQPHRELCETLTSGLDKSEHLDLNFNPPISGEYVNDNVEKLKKLILLPRGSFKCLKIDTNILMADGSVKKIQDIKVGDSVLGINNDTLQPEVAEVTHHSHMGNKDIYKVTTDNGQYKIESSENHRFYTPTGEYKELSELQVGDWIGVMANNYKNDKDYNISDDEIKFVAYMIFEGSVSSGNCGFTNFDKDIQNDFVNVANRLGFNVSEILSGQYRIRATDCRNKYNYNPRILLNELGAYGDKAIDKQLPEWVFNLSDRQKWLFLSVMFATDGYFSIDHNNRGNNRKSRVHIGINLGSYKLIEDIRILLLTLGLHFNVCEYDIHNKQSGKIYKGYSCSTSTADEILKLKEMDYCFSTKKDKLVECFNIAESIVNGHRATVCDLIPIDIKKHKINTGLYLRNNGVRVDNNYTCSRDKLIRLAEVDDNDYFRKYAESPIKWVKIKSIEYIGEYPTYDFETTTHNYVAEGFVVHNSTVATQALTLWLLWHNPNLRIMIDTEVKSNSKKYLAGIKDMIRNNQMLKLICVDEEGNYLLEPNMDIAGGWTDEQIILKHRTKVGLKEPSIICAGADIAVTGMHPDVIIMDDLVSERNVGTKDQIEKVKDHYRMSLSLLEPGGAQIVIGTRYHMNDLYADLLQFDTFDKLVRPAILEDGSLYFPSRLTHAFLEEKRKEQGTYIFNSQYMLSPIDDSNAVFKKAWIQYYDKLPPLVEVHLLTDLAISQKETADYTVVMAVGIAHDKRIYVMEYDRERFTPNETIESIFNMYLKYKPLYNIKTVGIEVVAFQKAMIYFIKDEMRRRGVYMPLKELKADGDKTRRIGALQPLFENGDVYIREEHSDLERELLEFPFSKHDDVADSLAYILQVIRAVSYDYKPQEYRYKPLNSKTGY